ncbi:MAG TPA: zinc ribbon domain-containing protein [Pyrinomonadaceae bacterium]|jgi:hypothetical protein
MHCPNCGSRNKKHQNYCRYCGLHLPDIEKLFLSQLVFGEDTKQLKKLRSAGKLIDYVQILLIFLFALGIFKIATTDFDGGKDLVKLSLVSFMLLLAADGVLKYFQRQSLKTNRRDVITSTQEGKFEARKTVRLIEEKPFYPVPSVSDASTELLFVDNKSNRSE